MNNLSFSSAYQIGIMDALPVMDHDNLTYLNDDFSSLSIADSDPLSKLQSNGFINAFVASLTVIIVSELGDKTFFIAAILAMKNSRVVVFVASMLALCIMTILASVMGAAITVVPKIYVHWASIVLFVIFGLKMLKEGYDMSPDEAKQELEAVESSIEKKNISHEQAAQNRSSCYATEDPETGVIMSIPVVPFKTKVKRKCLAFVSLAFIETFTMIFLAEWGDRSQISTLILAAKENVFAVTIGALLGHFLCTGLAVIGGRFVAQMISVRTGGIVFLLFAVCAVAMGI